MAELTIVANIVAEADQIELVKAELRKLVSVTLAEDGCLQYDLHQDNDDPARFLFFERWESRQQWQAHMNAPHLAAYGEATEGAVAEITLFEMSFVAGDGLTN